MKKKDFKMVMDEYRKLKGLYLNLLIERDLLKAENKKLRGEK